MVTYDAGPILHVKKAGFFFTFNTSCHSQEDKNSNII